MTNKKLICNNAAKNKSCPPALGEERLITAEESELTRLKRDTLIRNVNGRITVKGSFLKKGGIATLNFKINLSVAKRLLELFLCRAGYEDKSVLKIRKGSAAEDGRLEQNIATNLEI